MANQNTNRLFKCGIQACFYATNTVKNLDEHVHENHLCFCGWQGLDKRVHRCPTLVGGGGDLELPSFSTFPDGNEGPILHLKKSAIKNSVVIYEHEFQPDFIKIKDAYDFVYKQMYDLLHIYLEKVNMIKVQVTFHLSLEDVKTLEISLRYFHAGYLRLVNMRFIKPVLDFSYDLVDSQYQLISRSKSGVTLKRVEAIQIRIIKYTPTSASSYLPFPMKSCGKKRGLWNPKNKCLNCFSYCIYLHFYGEKCLSTLQQTSKNGKIKFLLQNAYDQLHEMNNDSGRLKMDQFMGKVDLSSIDLFEQINNVSVNVFGLCKEKRNKFVPIRITTVKFNDHINLILIRRSDLAAEDKKKYNTPYHYCLIRDTSAFFRKKTVKNKMILCNYCCNLLQPKLHKDHEEECLRVSKMRLTFPKDDYYRFKDFYKIMKPAFRAFCFLMPTVDMSGKISIYGFSILGVDPYDNIIYQSEHVGIDSIEKFVEQMLDTADYLLSKQRSSHLPLIVTAADLQRKKTTQRCQLYNCEFTPLNTAVIHHSHHRHDMPKKIICNTHNLQLKERPFIHFVLDNRHNIAMNAILIELKRTYKRKMMIVPHKENNLLSIILFNRLRLLCYNNFLDDEMETLLTSYDYPENEKQFAPYKQEFGDYYEELAFPSSYYHISIQDLNMQTLFPPLGSFIDNFVKMDADKYQRIQDFYTKKQFQNMKQYAVAFMRQKTLSMFAIFDSFSNLLQKFYGLSPYHHLTMAAFAWDAVFFKSKQEYQHIKDSKIIELVKNSCIGPISFHGMHRIDKEKDVNILSLDCHSQYLSQMCNALPQSSARLLTPQELANFSIEDVKNKDDQIGYLINASYKYPYWLKSVTLIFPFIVEKLSLAEDDPVRKAFLSQIQMPTDMNSCINIMTQLDKKEVTLHHESFLWFIENGMELEQIHFVVEFRQSQFLKPVMLYNQELKKKARNAHERRLIKSVGNFCYGKFHTIDYELSTHFASTAKRLQYLASLNNFHDCEILNEDLCLVKLKKNSQLSQKNILIASTILCLGRLQMYKLIYKLQGHFGLGNFAVGSVETDSCVAYVKSKNFIAELGVLTDIIDYTSFPESHILHHPTLNKEVPGMFKVEHVNAISFIKLRSKVYAYLFAECKNCPDLTQCKCPRETLIKGAKDNRLNFCHFEEALKRELDVVATTTVYKSTENGTQIMERKGRILRSHMKDRWPLQHYLISLPLGYEGQIPDGFRCRPTSQLPVDMV